MDHLIFLEETWNEIESLINGTKSMIIQGFDEINVPHWTFTEGDVIYFANDGGNNEIKARGIAELVIFSHPLSREESFEMIIKNQERLMLPDDQFYKLAGKRYLILAGIKDIKPVECEGQHLINRRHLSA